MYTRHLLCAAVCTLFILITHAQQDATALSPGPALNGEDDDGTSPPKIMTQSDPYLVFIPKAPVEIVCQAVGIPEPEYRWEKDGEDVDLSKYPLRGGNLYLAKPSYREEGIYRCFAHNQYGVAISSKIEFVMAFTDSFSDEQTIHTFTRGDAATIPCNNRESVPKPSVFWTDDSNPGQKIVLNNRVSVDPENNLRFSNIALEDMKNYQCNIKNDLLRVQHLSSIKEVVVRNVENVVGRPASLVYTPPSTVDAFRTKELRVKCMAEGFPTPSITWSKEGEELPAERTDYESYGQTLVIKDIIATDAGTYTCSASNGEGTPTKFSTTVVVKAFPYWENKPEDVNVVINDSGELDCQVAGVPLPAVTWLINGVPSGEAEPNPRRTITEGAGSGRVSIVDAVPEDSAVFQCVGMNEYGEVSASGFVNVQSIPAEISDAPQANFITVEQKSIELVCAGQGSPKPVVSWIFKGEKLETGGKYDIVEDGNSALTSSTLLVTGAVVDDSGEYTCSVSNGFGEVPAYSRVTVRMGTKIIIGPQKTITVVEDQDAVISCEIEHDAALPVEVTWTRDIGDGPQVLDLKVSGGRFKPERPGSDNLKVLETKVQDTGRYTCKAVTSMDEVEDYAELSVQTLAAAPSNVVVTQRADDSDTMAALEWDVGDDGNSPITNFIISYETDWSDLGWQEMKTIPAASTKTSLDLSPWVTYRFRVVAVNAIGNSEPSSLSQDYVTSAAALTEAPENVVMEPTDPGKMRVEWPEVHPYDQNGPGFKYVIRWREPGTEEWLTEEIDDYQTTSYVIDSGSNYKELEVEVMYKNDLGPGPASSETGFTGEGTPTDSPKNIQVSAEDTPGVVVVTWDEIPPESINGKLQAFLVYYSMADAQAQGQEPAECPPNADCRVSGLTPFQTYSFQVSVKNGQKEGPKSDAVVFQLPEGPAGPVLDLKVRALSDRLYVTWGAPALPNGVISGYNLSYSEVDGDTLVDTQVKEIKGKDTTSFKISAKPSTSYRIEIFAINGAEGAGDKEEKEVDTRPGGVPLEPVFGEGQLSPGLEQINVTFVQTSSGPAANSFYVLFKEANDDEADFVKSGSMDLLDSSLLIVKGLKRNTEYVMQIVAVNDDGSTKGPNQREKTLGGEAAVAPPIYVRGWFIALLIIIVALLCILLVLCILKSQRGGKYNVSDKEQQRKGDIESTPLKDDGGFEEFDPNKDNPDGELPRGSQGSLRDSEPGSSDTDSLKEYADGELGKFNEEGSFIGQYGDKKQRPADDGEQGGAAYSTFV
ncbi:neurofascin-like isoform X2 [Asterias rubens]|uniref:neurofascin-like isoform X2 n=1 Tax=Asterias rubens TaxID=7604 RepID=UPI0014553D54|nr:neurofascin-like isoform X2 [Asterias rubens]